MFKYTRHTTVIAAVLLVWSAATASASVDKSNTTITSVVAAQSGTARVLLIRTALGQGGEGCGDSDWAVIVASEPNAEQMYSTALAAYLSGRKVHVTLTNCTALPSPFNGAGYPWYGPATRPKVLRIVMAE